jgi:hypothetical protein
MKSGFPVLKHLTSHTLPTLFRFSFVNVRLVSGNRAVCRIFSWVICSSTFSCFLDLAQTPAAHLRTHRVTPVSRDTPVDINIYLWYDLDSLDQFRDY